MEDIDGEFQIIYEFYRNFFIHIFHFSGGFHFSECWISLYIIFIINYELWVQNPPYLKNWKSKKNLAN